MIDTNEILKTRAESAFAKFDRGDLLSPILLKPCRLKILMVADGYNGSFLNVSFSHSYFGLSAVLDTLRDNPEFFVRFEVTRAHRQTDPFKPPMGSPEFAKYGPHFEGFRFTQTGLDINNYDQVWLFGARGDVMDVDRLTDGELEILARWMDKGGSVFATGDHADLGASLCSRVPRVKSMRKWATGPLPTGDNRHDTLLKGHNATYTFDDESDDIPMHTTVKKYPLPSWLLFQKRSGPHPVLCGIDGIIDILPDHPHEGEIIDEALINTAATFSVGTYTGKPEYPSSGGTQPKPEVIAWAHVQNDHTDVSDTNKQSCDPKTFGAIGAYDGEAAGAGRIVVDSTWHHWFDVNLTGRPISALNAPPFNNTNPKTLGFLASPAGQQAWARIQNYFRNVAMWLASPSKRTCMYNRALWGVIIRYPLVERLSPKLSIWDLGITARDVIGRLAGQCTIREWIGFDLPILVQKAWPRIPLPDPCLTCPPGEVLDIYVLGGIVREMLTLGYASEAKGRVEETEVMAAQKAGALAGMKELQSDLRKSLERTSGLERSFSAAVSRVLQGGAPKGTKSAKKKRQKA